VANPDASYASEDGEWVTVTPEGFFDASTKGAKMLNVVRGLEAYSVDQFYPFLYRPDLVREKLAGDPTAGAGSRGEARSGQGHREPGPPQVTIVSPASGAGSSDSTATIEARLTEQGGGIGNVEWRVNGVRARS